MPDAKLSHLVSASGESSSLLLRFVVNRREIALTFVFVVFNLQGRGSRSSSHLTWVLPFVEFCLCCYVRYWISNRFSFREILFWKCEDKHRIAVCFRFRFRFLSIARAPDFDFCACLSSLLISRSFCFPYDFDLSFREISFSSGFQFRRSSSIFIVHVFSGAVCCGIARACNLMF